MMRFIAKQNGQNNVICDDKSLWVVVVIGGSPRCMMSCYGGTCIGWGGILRETFGGHSVGRPYEYK